MATYDKNGGNIYFFSCRMYLIYFVFKINTVRPIVDNILKLLFDESVFMLNNPRTACSPRVDVRI